MDKITEQKLTELFNSENAKAKLNAIDDIEELKQFLDENDIELSYEDLAELLKSAVACSEKSNSDELTEEDMDNVSGGLIGWIILGGILAGAGGWGANKARKLYNQATGKCSDCCG